MSQSHTQLDSHNQLCFTDVNTHVNESSDIKLVSGLNSYSIRLRSPNNKIINYYVLLIHLCILMNESSDIKLFYELRSYSIRLTSPNDKTIIYYVLPM